MRMNNLFKLTLGIVVLIGLNACQSAEEEFKETQPPVSFSSHAISEKDALTNLNDFLKSSNGTRAKDNHPEIMNIIPMKLEKVTTSAMAPNNAENVIYVANFSEEKGFAVLAADDRIQEKVIAVADKSNLTKEDVDAVATFFMNKETYMDEDYPTTGAGLFTVEDYPDEVFLNPNTFSTYDETQDDNWVGNFSEEDSLPITRAVASSEYTNRRIALSYCVDYALDEVTIEGGSERLNNSYTTNTTYSDWKDVQRTKNILSAYVGWHQGSPFNDLYPKKRKYILFGHKKKAPAGCFPLSLAKILTNFRQPGKFSYNGNTVDWDALSNVNTVLGRKSAAVLLKGISEWCGSMYFYKGTFTFPSKASSFLKKMGYDDVKRFNYSYGRVTSMINSNCPVLIYAIPGIKIWNSHAWIIDGYKVKVRQKITKQYKNGTLISTSTIPDTCRMVHCDFGWNGHCNGYYVDGVFKLNSDKNDYDYPYQDKKKTKYNHHMRIITYKK